jgi:hypothetical protein
MQGDYTKLPAFDKARFHYLQRLGNGTDYGASDRVKIALLRTILKHRDRKCSWALAAFHEEYESSQIFNEEG